MILAKYPYFYLETAKLGYLFSVLPTKKLEHMYFGKKLVDYRYEALHLKLSAGAGSSIEYENEGYKTLLDLMTLEFSEVGKGDFRLTPMELKMPDQSFVSDFVYDSFEIIKGTVESKKLPTAQKGENVQSLVVKLKDKKFNIELKLIYTVFEKSNIITRRTVLINHEEQPVVIRKLMSMMFDVAESDYDLLTFDGGWIKEAHKHLRPLSYGTYIVDSTTGASSNRHNPGIILAKKGTHEDYGDCIGINLIYSGNHYEAVQISNHGLMRVMTGINPHCFEWTLKTNESFETPEAVLSFSDLGFNDLSHNFHDFVNNHIIPRQFKKTLRPIVLNSWEAFYFNFNTKKLLTLAKQAKALGVELFVLDDGWFGKRNSDTEGLGDYKVNKRKLRGGLKNLSDKIHELDMRFGLWFEPEMVNPKSELFKKNPDWAVSIEQRDPSLGRNQLVLDLCKPMVREYIINEISKVLDSTTIDYVKWDMNRHMTDMFSSALVEQGRFFHQYILGLYEILFKLRSKYPDIIIESCSSGGNRFDLGMLCFSPQIWTSDNTDPIERLKIQEGFSYLYPQSTMSAHVSLAPHTQTIRRTPLSTRFNVASFGVLGYELNLKYVSKAEKEEMKKQIALYKENREIFQFGEFNRFNAKDDDHKIWQVSMGDQHIVGYFQTKYHSSPNLEVLHVKNVNPNMMYKIESIQQTMELRQFGHLITHALPIKIHPDGWLMSKINQRKQLENATESYEVSGQAMISGVKLKQQFSGTYYNNETRILGDFGSQIYVVNKLES
ncbi:MAG: alpha-galactosidase [Acholeplasmataceae bacterium]|jgi:alpha-galactosidase|nr:alpha-galactosidase [Acholeplasmataceae bacterium]